MRNTVTVLIAAGLAAVIALTALTRGSAPGEGVEPVLGFDTSKSFRAWLGASAGSAVSFTFRLDPDHDRLSCWRFDRNVREFYRDRLPESGEKLRGLLAASLMETSATDGTCPVPLFVQIAQRYAGCRHPFAVVLWTDGEQSDTSGVTQRRLTSAAAALARNPNCACVALLGVRPAQWGYWSAAMAPLGDRYMPSTKVDAGAVAERLDAARRTR